MPRSSVAKKKKKREGFENEERHSGYTIPAPRQGDDGGGRGRWADGGTGAGGKHEREGETFVIFLL